MAPPLGFAAPVVAWRALPPRGACAPSVRRAGGPTPRQARWHLPGARRVARGHGRPPVAVAPPPEPEAGAPTSPPAPAAGGGGGEAAPLPPGTPPVGGEAATDTAAAAAAAAARAAAFLPMRRALTILAVFGVMETTFLTLTKALATPAAICGTRGCVDVLSGPYSSFLGIPLSAFGVLSYGAFAVLAGWPLAVPPTSPAYVGRDAATRPLMVGLAGAMAVFSAYLVGLLAFVIRSPCVYCLTSAGVCAALFVGTVLVGRAVPDGRAAARIGGVGGVAAALLSGVVFLSAPVHARPPTAPPAITTVSDRKAMALAKRLEEQGATMFGAYWCSHCYAQKQLFGADAFARIKYVECARDGADTQAGLCRSKKVPGYPTWEINGGLYPGEMDLDDLRAIVDGRVPPTYVPPGEPAAAPAAAAAAAAAPAE